MPLSKIQIGILRLLAAHRDIKSYAARYSGDIDVFHGREERVAEAARHDTTLLEQHGYSLRWIRREPAMQTVAVSSQDESTKLEWLADSDFRFFPAVRDEIFGYVLHPVDLAANKVVAAADRREVRDLMDLVTVHQTILPLGAVVWAAVGKSPGFTPEGLIAEIRRNSHYPLAEWRALVTEDPLDPAAVMENLRTALKEAADFVAQMPTDQAGVLFLDHGQVVQPAPDRLSAYEIHTGHRHGHWPTSADIGAAMFERYKRPPE